MSRNIAHEVSAYTDSWRTEALSWLFCEHVSIWGPGIMASDQHATEWVSTSSTDPPGNDLPHLQKYKIKVKIKRERERDAQTFEGSSSPRGTNVVR